MFKRNKRQLIIKQLPAGVDDMEPWMPTYNARHRWILVVLQRSRDSWLKLHRAEREMIVATTAVLSTTKG